MVLNYYDEYDDFEYEVDWKDVKSALLNIFSDMSDEELRETAIELIDDEEEIQYIKGLNREELKEYLLDLDGIEQEFEEYLKDYFEEDAWQFYRDGDPNEDAYWFWCCSRGV